MRALVIGGNRFFGKRLVQHLLDAKWEVTLLNRGNLDDGFGATVKRIRMDRNQMTKDVPELQKNWDIVYDQVCYDSNEAKKACEIFNGRTGKYIFTSTMSVYETRGDLTEADFDPFRYSYAKPVTKAEDYGEAKRQAEATFFSNMKCPIIAVRFPIVLGIDDYTHRLKFHVDRISAGRPFYLPKPDAKIVFIDVKDAGKFLYFLSQVDFKGPINCASQDPITLRQLISTIENITHQKALLTEKGRADESPLGLESDWYMSSEKAKNLGFECRPHVDWLPKLIEQLDRENQLKDLC